jgi:hypothetical protein
MVCGEHRRTQFSLADPTMHFVTNWQIEQFSDNRMSLMQSLRLGTLQEQVDFDHTLTTYVFPQD